MKYHKKYSVLIFCMMILFNYPYILQASENVRLAIDDVTDFKKVIAYRDRASSERREQSMRSYEYALAHHDIGASVKLLAESIASYPKSRVYSKYAEYKLKQLRYKESDIKYIALNIAIRHLHVAVKLNNIDSMLSKAEVKAVNNNIICIKKYLDVKTIVQGCEALEWIDIR